MPTDRNKKPYIRKIDVEVPKRRRPRQIMERCNVCSEKAYLSLCAHCEKKICEDCKSAHMDILRREITRFNSQIRRSLHRLQDSLAIIEKNTNSLQANCGSVADEIEEIYRRITKAIKDRTDHLKGEIDRYLATELRNLTSLKENLDLEITNIASNCDVVDKYMNDSVEWDDCELMDTKEIFLKTVEFLRHFEYENSDYSRRVRFVVSMDPNQLVMNLAAFGDLNIAPHGASTLSSSTHLAPPSSALQPGLMRSKSDHRLATQFRQQEERSGYNDEPVLGGRKFGERPIRSATDRYGADAGTGGRYGRDYDYDNDYENEPSTRPSGKSRFRSRFVRSHQNEDSDTEQQQLQRQELEKRKDRVLDGEDVTRGQLSGIIRLSDCARVIQRLADIGKEKKEKKVDLAGQAAAQAAIQAQKASMQRPKPAAQRQVSEDDEISRIKRQNKNAPGASTTAAAAAATATAAAQQESERPNAERVTALRRGTTATQGTSEDSDSSNHRASSVRRTPPRAEVSVRTKKKKAINMPKLQETREPDDIETEEQYRPSEDSMLYRLGSSITIYETNTQTEEEEQEIKTEIEELEIDTYAEIEDEFGNNTEMEYEQPAAYTEIEENGFETDFRTGVDELGVIEGTIDSAGYDTQYEQEVKVVRQEITKFSKRRKHCSPIFEAHGVRLVNIAAGAREIRIKGGADRPDDKKKQEKDRVKKDDKLMKAVEALEKAKEVIKNQAEKNRKLKKKSRKRQRRTCEKSEESEDGEETESEVECSSETDSESSDTSEIFECEEENEAEEYEDYDDTESSSDSNDVNSMKYIRKRTEENDYDD